MIYKVPDYDKFRWYCFTVASVLSVSVLLYPKARPRQFAE